MRIMPFDLFTSRRRSRASVALRFAALAALASTAVALPRPSVAAHAAAKGPFVIGFSNNLVGNGWREEMICSAKAEANVSHGLVKKVIVSDINGSAAQQIAGIRTLISSGVNALIIDPPDATSLNGVIQEATRRGIVVVIVDSFINSPLPYQAANDQVAYGRLGMEWLAKRLHGKGNVVLLQGAAGVPADTDRYTGIQQALKEYPGIKVLAKPYTNWQFAQGGQDMLNLLNAYKNINGVWTSGIDYTVVSAFQTARRAYVPVVGADNNGFVKQLLQMHGQGVDGAAVTNPANIGGVGMSIALRVLQGQSVPKKTTLTPKVWDYASNRAALQSHYLPSQAPTYSVQYDIAPYTHYTKDQLFAACK